SILAGWPDLVGDIAFVIVNVPHQWPGHPRFRLALEHELASLRRSHVALNQKQPVSVVLDQSDPADCGPAAGQRNRRRFLVWRQNAREEILSDWSRRLLLLMSDPLIASNAAVMWGSWKIAGFGVPRLGSWAGDRPCHRFIAPTH